MVFQKNDRRIIRNEAVNLEVEQPLRHLLPVYRINPHFQPFLMGLANRPPRNLFVPYHRARSCPP